MEKPAASPKPKKNLNWIIFQDIREIYETFSGYCAIDLSPTRSRTNVAKCWINQIVTTVFMLIAFGSTVTEHRAKRGEFLDYCRNGILIFGNLLVSWSFLILYKHHQQLEELVDYFDTLSRTINYDEESLLKKVKMLSRLPFIIPVVNGGLNIIVNLLFDAQTLPVPFMLSKLLMVYKEWFYFAFIYIVLINCIFLLDFCFLIGTYLVCLEHISAQYDLLSEKLNSLAMTEQDADQKYIVEELSNIGKTHVELLERLQIVRKIFKYPLLSLEIFCVMASTMAGLIFQYEQSSWIFGVQCIFFTLYNFIFPIYGQKITNSAENFASAAYECNWIKFSPKNRRAVMMIIMQGQKVAGVTAGGFHYSNHAQITAVSIHSFEPTLPLKFILAHAIVVLLYF